MSEQEPLETVEVCTGETPTHTVIWLHGLGADGHDFEPLVPQLDLGGHAVRFVFPHAPVRAVTLNQGYPMRAWYDILALGEGARQDADGVRASAVQVQALIAREAGRGIAPARIVLAGFSQGGAVALHAGLRQREPLAGIIALSTYLPLAERFADERAGESQQVPVFMAHGTADPVLSLQWAESSRERLRALGYQVEWHAYPMAHQVCLEEVQAIAAWLRQLFGPVGAVRNAG